MAHQPTTFYSASAGSGKTYTLARDYLTLLFKSDFNNGYREILAITFTNKAVAEMKQRILENLHAFTQVDLPQNLIAIRDHIKAETGLDNAGIQKKARKIEQKLLHDYAAFDIVTIDSFNHRILRTFAREVELPDGFEIELDSGRLISKAIHNLIARAGKEKQLTDLLVDFSLSKIDDGKSWDIEFDLHNIAVLILSESHYNYIQQLKEKSIEDFLELRKQLRSYIKTAQTDIISKGKKLLDYYTSNGLTQNDFSGKSRGIYGWIQKIGTGNIPANGQQKYLEKALTDSIAGSTSAGNQSTIDAVQSDLVDLIQTFQENSGTIALHQNALSSITALSLLNELMHEVDNIKQDEQIVPIYEFNGILSKQIKDQPAPFIYERLGERYRHYFIDEFQDTSKMQWENLMPLIENPLVQMRDDGTKGSLMLVGDAKQSIYRWRGGDADQFLGILGSGQLFLQEKQNETLDTNWRSFDTIIKFNNELFKHYGSYLNSDLYKELYENFLHQESTDKTGGYVQIDFLDSDENENLEADLELNSVYPIHVKRQIDQALTNGFGPSEICVLVRKKKQGDEIARYLVRQDMSVVSADSLLVAASPRVQLLVQFMHMCMYTEQQQPRYEFLLQYAVLKNQPLIHQFIQSHLQSDIDVLTRDLLSGDDDVYLAFAKAPLFQATEKAADALGLFEDHDMRLQAFLEHVFEFGTGYDKTASGFLESWENKQTGLSVPAAEDPSAIQIMTIHKSKGLEFPVVIVPYCDVLLEEMRDAAGWMPINAENYLGFEHLYISLKKECLLYPEPAPAMYNEQLAKAQMDQINTLYVAFTRAKEQLFISCFENKKEKNNYSKVLMEFVENSKWSLEQKTEYKTSNHGSPARITEAEATTASILMEDYFVSERVDRIDISTRKGMLWASEAMEAIDAGTQLHDYLSMIQDVNDLDRVEKAIGLDRSLDDNEGKKLYEKIQRIVSDSKLAEYYKDGIQAINERAILTSDGSKSIPDRLVFDDKKVTVIDYKTGNESPKHKTQVNRYADLLSSMGYSIEHKILIYTDDLHIVKWS
ncbi:ATP-dependent exoDNAse (exonuclease V) beta subunit (contains helicase and exonuclease domains) [Nonlabens sp. Hel1_33_55]|uniref:UvrD-helicase domain-containing protein n=1 Tax=Nonlabens sp. Hel1_33_55 TaxID=1336802 RepID=UPI000875C1C7|nr:UvrD-helicase domain-containing protein [Nonlabens sp. Hel1_33_55]SCY29312.1 ATP-dependent exoDNAse (exonuclease V) beta subunit (contains helicase and exonuclease domains) [Nonlabens sp. Hel1_33_55]